MMTYEALIEEYKRIKEMSRQMAIKKGLPENNIILDGVYEKYLEKYINTNPHILWILKEAPETNEVYGWHVGDIDEKNPALQKKSGTLRQMCLISYAILKQRNYEDACKASIKDLVDARQRVAHINVCKIKTTAGKNSAGDLTSGYEIWKDALDAQINAYQPEIIICGNTLQYFSNDDNYFRTIRSEKKLLESIIPNPSQKFCYYSGNDRLLINIHHPSDFSVNWEKCINEIVNIVMQWSLNKKST
jgi:hypothetical protein